MESIGELHSLTTADGKTFFFPDQKQMFLVYGGYGAPPISHQTRRGYRQHGATHTGYLLEPRSISVEMYHVAGCDRATYWRNRSKWLDFIRPNRCGALTLTIWLPDGSKRALSVWYEDGLAFDANLDRESNWNLRESVSFVAYDPVWFSPDVTVITPSASFGSNLVFPAAFPIWFEQSGIIFDTTINYAGTWKEYPSLTLTGSYLNATMENLATGARIQLSAPIADGDKRIITLRPGERSIVDSSGVSRFGELTSDSNLNDFTLSPTPESANPQTIRVTLNNAGVGAGVQMRYQERYFGI